MSESDEIPALPSPWTLHGSSWAFLYYSKAGSVDAPGFAHPLERDAVLGPSNGDHKGGVSTVLIVRYAESPAGAYDELMVIPGKFTNPINDEAHLRITRIYVSSDISTFNGRRNWNIPKHVARFQFDTLPDGSTKIQVFQPSPDAVKPFFAAVAKPVRFVPTIPIKTSWLHMDKQLTLVQPPLPSLTNVKQPEGGNPAALVGTSDWCSVLPVVGGKSRVVYFSPALESQAGDGALRYGDGESFPDLQPWSYGFEYLDGTRLEFPVRGDICRRESDKTK